MSASGSAAAATAASGSSSSAAGASGEQREGPRRDTKKVSEASFRPLFWEAFSSNVSRGRKKCRFPTVSKLS